MTLVERLSPYLGAALPLGIALLLWLYVRRRRRVSGLLGDGPLVALLAGSDLRRVPWLRAGLVFVAAGLLAAALADPRWGTASEAAGRETGPVALVLDASTSMLVEDVGASRMEVERALARAIVGELPGTPVGVVVFSGRAYALSPPTVDPGAVALYLEALDPQIVTQSGSSLAAAIRQGVGLLALAASEGPAGSVVLLTDGDVAEDEETVAEAASLARRAGVPVHVVGVGSAEGGPVPGFDPATGSPRDFIRDAGGAVVESRLREETLRDIARTSGGEYVAWSDDDAVRRVVAALRRGGAEEGGGAEVPGAPRYAWFALPALVLLAVEPLARRRQGSGER